MKIPRLLWALVLLILGLTACSNDATALSELLTKGKPTVLFFYTDN